MPNYALVTGGSRGIGRAICLKLAEQGFNLLINYRSNLERAQQTLTEVQEFGVEAELIPFDIGDSKAVKEQLGGSLSSWYARSVTHLRVLFKHSHIHSGFQGVAILRRIH